MKDWNWLKSEKAKGKLFLGMGFTEKDVNQLITLQRGDLVQLSRSQILQTSCPPEERGLKWIKAVVAARYPTYVVFQTPLYAVSILNVDLLFQEDKIIRMVKSDRLVLAYQTADNSTFINVP